MKPRGTPEKLSAQLPRSRMSRLDVSFDLCQIGVLESEQQRYGDAADAFRRCAVIRSELVKEEPRDVRARDRTAYSEMLLAHALLLAKRDHEAEPHAAVIDEAGELIAMAPSLERSALDTIAAVYRITALALDQSGKHARACSAYPKGGRQLRPDRQTGRIVQRRVMRAVRAYRIGRVQALNVPCA
jgi:hypothetical protein